MQKFVEEQNCEYTQLPIEVLMLRYNNGDYKIPSYQRQFEWTEEDQQRFINSIAKRNVIPSLVLNEDTNEGLSDIIDGQNRMRTLYKFCQEKLILMMKK